MYFLTLRVLALRSTDTYYVIRYVCGFEMEPYAD